VAAHLVGRRRRGEQVKGRWPAGAKSTAALASRTSPICLKEDVYRCPAGERLLAGSRQGAAALLDNGMSEMLAQISMHDGAGGRASRDGSMSICLKRCSNASTRTRAMRQRRETVEHPFGTIKARMGATHFLTKTLPKVAAEMALSVLAYNLARAMNIVGVKPLLAVFCRKDQHFIRIGIRSTATTQPKRPRVCLWKQHLVCA